MTVQPLAQPVEVPDTVGAQWTAIAAHAPALASTIGRYLNQIATFLAPASVMAADQSLRHFANYLVELEPHIRRAGDVDRDVAEHGGALDRLEHAVAEARVSRREAGGGVVR